MRIDVLGIPPTAAQLGVALSETEEQWSSYYRRSKRYTLLASTGYFVAGLIAVVAMIFYSDRWLGAIGTFVGAVGALAIWIFNDERKPETPARRPDVFEPIVPYFAEQILRAIEIDPRLDLYRLAVVKQGRELTILEAQAFYEWERDGFRISEVMAAVRGASPVVDFSATGDEVPA